MTLRIREVLQVQCGDGEPSHAALRTWRVSRAGVLLDSRLTLDAALDTAAVLGRPGEPCLIAPCPRTLRSVDLAPSVWLTGTDDDEAHDDDWREADQSEY